MDYRVNETTVKRKIITCHIYSMYKKIHSLKRTMSREIAQKRGAWVTERRGTRRSGTGGCRPLDKWRAYLAIQVFHVPS